MSRYLLTLIVLTQLVLAADSQQLRGCNLQADRIIAEKTIQTLPQPLKDFFSAKREALIERAIEPGAVWPGIPHYSVRKSWHYLMIDAAAAIDPTGQERINAALAFPAQQQEAKRLFRDQDIRRGGSLLWHLPPMVDQLTTAFNEGDHDTIVKHAGYLIHFCSDAANPFNVTRNRRGTETGNLDFGNVPIGDPIFAHQDVAHRIGWELIRRNGHRYAERIEPQKIRFELTTNVPAFIMENMIDSLDGLAVLCKADNKIMELSKMSDRDTFTSRMDEYYLLLDQACGKQCVENLKRGIRLSTTLIVFAWQKAESPDLLNPPKPETESENQPQSRSVGNSTANESNETISKESAEEKQAAEPTQYFVASKNSKKYHRPDCYHAKRISEKNLIKFSSIKEAEESGRTPCNTCKPNEEKKEN